MLPAQTLLFVCNASNDAFTILTHAFVTQLSMAVLASLRITGVGGFGPQRADFADVQKKGWCSYYTTDYRGQPDMSSPHYQSWLWAVYLWAYRARAGRCLLPSLRLRQVGSVGV